MRLSRHAKNEMRLYRIDQHDVEATMNAPEARETDEATHDSAARRQMVALFLWWLPRMIRSS